MVLNGLSPDLNGPTEGLSPTFLGKDLSSQSQFLGILPSDEFVGAEAYPLVGDSLVEISSIQIQEGTTHNKRSNLATYFQETAKDFRLRAKEMLDQGFPARKVQEFITQYYQVATESLAKEAIHHLSILGKELPCEYAILGLGSIAKGEASPFSDLDFAVVISEDTPENRSYFQEMFTEMNQLVELFGESDRTNRGFAFCQGELNPPYEMIYHSGQEDEERKLVGSPQLIGTAKDLVRHSVISKEATTQNGRAIGADPSQISGALQLIGFLAGKASLAQDVRRAQKQLLSQTITKAEASAQFPNLTILPRGKISLGQARALNWMVSLEENFSRIDRLRGETVLEINLKSMIIKPIQSAVIGLSLYYGVQEPNTTKAMAQLMKGGFLNENLGKKLIEIYDLVSGIRLKSQLLSGEEGDLVKINPEPDRAGYSLSEQEKKGLINAYSVLATVQQLYHDFIQSGGSKNTFNL